ncbi:MAG: DNA polymerase III subunit chi [Polaromonas sp.]
MTDIEFHVNLPDKLHYSCRLLRKAYRSGTKAVVTAEPEVLQQLDHLLWSYSSTEFLPHCKSDSPAPTVAATPILLTDQLNTYPAGSVLINLGQQVPAGFERFERFIEVASSLEADRLAARDRWKHYRDRGYSLKRHELQPVAESA